MTLSILLRTSEFRGDHSADVEIAHEVIAGETVEQLAKRLFSQASGEDTAVIEIRTVVEGKS